MSRELLFQGPLIEGGYFLEPEELFGMKYSFMSEGWPVPLKYYTRFPIAEHPAFGKSYRVIYSGYRPVDSFVMHKYYSLRKHYPFNVSNAKQDYFLLCSQMNINKNPDQRQLVGMRSNLPTEVLHFNAKFENGNLDKVVMISENEYDLYIRSDTNAVRKFSWFNFKVTNCTNRGMVKFNVVNMTDSPFLYKRGKMPATYENRSKWTYEATNIEYIPSKLNLSQGYHNRKQLYQLSFHYSFTANTKEVQFARSIPYSFSSLMRSISENSKSSYFKSKILGHCIGGLSLPIITITNFALSKKNKKYILVVGRLNPGETSSSFIIEGIINFLLSECTEACRSRDAFIYKIIPMANPEGVVAGNSRTNLAGMNLHKNLSEMTEILSLAPKLIRKLSHKLQSKRGIFLQLELSGSLTNLGSYIQCVNDYKEPHKKYTTKVIPELVSKYSIISRILPNSLAPGYFASPLQLAIERDVHIESYTIETSVYGYKNEKDVYAAFDSKLLNSHGFIIGESVFKYSTLGNININELMVSMPSSSSANQESSESEDIEFEDSEVSEGNDYMESIIRDVIKEKSVKKSEFNLNQSSDDEDSDNKELLLESIQDFCTINRKKKTKVKKIEIKTKVPCAISDSITLNHSSSQAIGLNAAFNKNSKKRCLFSMNYIDFSQICSNHETSMPLLKNDLKKTPSSIMRVNKTKRSLETRGSQSFEIPKINQRNLQTVKFGEERQKKRFQMFGPFSRLNEITSLNRAIKNIAIDTSIA